MFWPFNKWVFAPPPYGPQAGGSGWNAPVQTRRSPFGFLTSHDWPKHPQRFYAAAQEQLAGAAPPSIFMPRYARTAFSKHPLEAAQLLTQEQKRISSLARSALAKSAAGVPMRIDELDVLMQVRLPPVARRLHREGAGAYGIDRIPPVPRGGIPESVKQAALAQTLMQSAAGGGVAAQTSGQYMEQRAKILRAQMLDAPLINLLRRGSYIRGE